MAGYHPRLFGELCQPLPGIVARVLTVVKLMNNLIALITFVIIPLITGVTVHYWFPLLPFVKKVKECARQWDSEAFQIPHSLRTLKELRQYNGVGDKTVVTHHLMWLCRQIEDRILTSILMSAVSALVLIFFVVVVTADKAPQQQPGGGQPGFGQALLGALNQIPSYFAFPLAYVSYILKSWFELLMLREQVLRYRDSIDI